MLGAYPGIWIISVEFWTPLKLGLLFQALLDKNPEHRASLWHLKEHEWILQEVKRDENQNWSNVTFSSGGCKPLPIVWCHPLLWIGAAASYSLQVSVFCRFLDIFPGREVEGWQEGLDKPSAEVQVLRNCLKCLWDPSLSWPLSYKHFQLSGLADHHPLLGDSQEPSLELSSLESNAIRFCEIMKRSQHILTQPCSSNVSSSGMEMGSQLGANSLIDEQL